jgi:hypothetical protein
MPPKGEPIPREMLEPALYSTGRTSQGVQAVLHSSEWQAVESRDSQVVVLWGFAETDTTTMLSADDIRKLFNFRADNVCQIEEFSEDQHRPLTLDIEQEDDVIRFIHTPFHSQKSPDGRMDKEILGWLQT